MVEREAEAGGMLGNLDSYEIEGGETKSEILQNLGEFQFSCVCLFENIYIFIGVCSIFMTSWSISNMNVTI